MEATITFLVQKRAFLRTISKQKLRFWYRNGPFCAQFRNKNYVFGAETVLFAHDFEANMVFLVQKRAFLRTISKQTWHFLGMAANMFVTSSIVTFGKSGFWIRVSVGLGLGLD